MYGHRQALSVGIRTSNSYSTLTWSYLLHDAALSSLTQATDDPLVPAPSPSNAGPLASIIGIAETGRRRMMMNVIPSRGQNLTHRAATSHQLTTSTSLGHVMYACSTLVALAAHCI